MRLAVFTNVVHQKKNGQYFGYAPYVREMNIWLKQVDQAEIIAPLGNRGNYSSEISYCHDKIFFTRVPFLSFLSLKDSLFSLVKIPQVLFKMASAMSRADHIHIRCPGNIGLLACVLQIFFPYKMKSAKYAGNWDPEAEQPWTYKLQKWILSNTFLTTSMTVLVYGEWQKESKNIKTFFTASFPETAILKVQEKVFQEPYIFLFVGNLVQGKGLKIALKTIRKLQERGVECSIDIFGEGPERGLMEAYVHETGIKNINFRGNRNLKELEQAYQIAHFVILPSKSEGWPKAIAEGMFFGCIPVVTDVSCVRWMLGNEKRGIIIDNPWLEGESTEITEKNVERLLRILNDGERMKRMSIAAKAWSQEYTLDKFEAAIKEILVKGKEPKG